MAKTLQTYISAPLPIETELLRIFNREDSLVIFDVGASEGEDSIRYGKLFPNSKLFLFEPLPENIVKLRKNLERFSKNQTQVEEVALSDEVGEVEFYVSSGHGVDLVDEEGYEYAAAPASRSSSLLAPDLHLQLHPHIKFDNKVTVQTETLDRYLAANKIEKVNIMHLDVQGAELKVLSGAGDQLSKVDVIWMEVESVSLYKGQPLKSDVEKFMQTRGFVKIKDTVKNVAGDQLYIRRDLFIAKLGISYILNEIKMEAAQKLRDLKKAIKKLIASQKPKQLKVGTTNKKTRDVWVEAALKRIPAGKKILDAGAGELRYKPFCSHLEYVSQDLGQYDGVGDGAGLHTVTFDNSKLDIVSDIIDIPVEDQSFDAILCTEVFEHIVEPAKAVKEFARILKPGGYLVITAPFASMTHYAPFFYANGYSNYWYREVLEREGFKDIEITPNGNYFEYLAQELRRMDKIAEKYGAGTMSASEKRARQSLLQAMQRFSNNGRGSSELLHFGNQVFARKA